MTTLYVGQDLKTCLTSVLGWKAAGLSWGENFGTAEAVAVAAELSEATVAAAAEAEAVAEGMARRLKTSRKN